MVIKRAIAVLFVSAFAFAMTQSAVAQVAPWNISLRNGWNLIAFPVVPPDPTVGVVLGDLIAQGVVESLWTYDSTTEEWSVFLPGITLPGVPAIAQIETGRGYWIKVSGSPTLSMPPVDPPLPVASLAELARGWNLIATSADEPKPFDRIFDGVPIREIWTFDAAGGIFRGVVLPPSGAGAPTRQDFIEMQPDLGYWVLLDQSQPGVVSFGPDLGTSLPGDVDVMPLLPPATIPGLRIPWSALTAGDEDIGLDGFYDSPVTQRALTFRDFAETQNITVFNEGTGVLSFVATIDEQSPLCGGVAASPFPWLSFRVKDSVTGDLIDLPLLTGSVSTESASLQLVANRTGLTPRIYCSVVNIVTNSVSGDPDDTFRQITAFIEIPELEGDYEITARIHSINGEEADMPSPRFHMSLYRDADGLKAILDEARTLLLPRRVRMVGDVYQTGTNRFMVSSSFSLETGDSANPYNAPLRRDITFVARRRERADPPRSGSGPLDLVGEYGETIYGALGDRIHLAGTLTGRRAAPKPSVLDSASVQSLMIQQILDGGTTEYEFDITDKRLIKEIVATLDLTHTSPTDLWIRLEPPGALGIGELTLRRASDNTLESISFERTQTSVDDLSVLSGLIATGTWRVLIEDEVLNGETGLVTGAGLDILGTRVFNVSGTVSGVGAGASVLLSGCGLALATTTDSAGDYKFENLIDCTYRLSVQESGLERARVDVTIDPNGSDVSVDIAPGPGSPVPDANVGLPCERNGGICDRNGLAFVSLTTTAGAGALLPRAKLAEVMDAATFDTDRPPLNQIGPEDTVLFSDAENPVTLANACVTLSNPAVQGSPCTDPGDGDIDPPIGVNSSKNSMAIGGPVSGHTVRGDLQLSIGANP